MPFIKDIRENWLDAALSLTGNWMDKNLSAANTLLPILRYILGPPF